MITLFCCSQWMWLWEYCRRFLFDWQIDPVDVTPSLRDALWSREQSATKLVINRENWKKKLSILLLEPSPLRLCVNILVHYETDATNLKVHSDTGTRPMQTISPYGRRENEQAYFDTAYFFFYLRSGANGGPKIMSLQYLRSGSLIFHL